MTHPLQNLTSPAAPFDPADTPVEATVARGGRRLTMVWADGSEASASAERLRLSCRCAWCTRARADGRFPDAFDGAALAAVEPMGGYAVHLTFADGHDRGIFPWSFLRRLAADEAAPRETAAAA
ncbi:MAG: DUF971 domain-containing protein [Ancylobacter novellus]|uniref:DUF971 domain-containing protein n=1 Tax=Ancylobacter novellus TaxID=921 RepID=A0A2W5KTJ6_ANCNO|nr:MAG: DUF971 domain-containing protein [Ancylobacter novellus]